jgi:DNA (cytosine-5)-methyltransferase 1
MNVLDLFSGIGGFSLGLERAGMRTVAFCESDAFCRRVLAKHWPGVPIYGDVRTLTAARLAADGIIAPLADAIIGASGCSHGTAFIPGNVLEASKRQEISNGLGIGCNWTGIDLICGGFPCQDISVAGKGAGIGGERSGLWSEFARIIGEVRPRYVIVENVAALLGRGISRVLGDLAALGFDAEWHCIPASAVGAPHRRDRIWIVAHPARDVRSERKEGGAEWQRVGPRRQPVHGHCESGSCCFNPNECDGNDCWLLRHPEQAPDMADASEPRLQGCSRQGLSRSWGTSIELAGGDSGVSYTNGKPTQRLTISWGECGQWLTEPDVGRVANGVPARVDRLRVLGNAVVPQIAEIIGRAIMSIERDEYNAEDDFARSIDECYREIRARKAAGGKGWGE